MNQDVIVLANGAFPKSPQLIEKIRQAETLVCCDGAINKLEKINVEPTVIIGDLDSIQPHIKEKYKDRIIHYSEQDTNDLTKTIRWCIAQNFKNITILGGTGEREDHSIANIFLLLNYCQEVSVRMISDYGIFTPILKTSSFKSFKGQQVSLFTTSKDLKITSHNLKYPLKEMSLKELWNGSLNESLGEEFSISLSGNGGLIVYQVG